jgi:ribose 5-phosphate isomerase A
MDAVEELKRAAAAEAVARVRSGMKLGLGTGSTVAHFLDLLGAEISEGRLTGIVGVPTSERTTMASRALGIPLSTLAATPRLDLAVDGADEVNPRLDAIKGLGGALLREKMVAQAADQFILIVDEGKLVQGLGEKSPVPVEVVRFGWESHLPALEGMGAEPVLRVGQDGEPYVTDNANYIIDAHFPEGIGDPVALDRGLGARAGIVETGLFLGMAAAVMVASPRGTRVMER